MDLHGMRQTEAYRALRKFVANAQQRGARFVIVITGKGNRHAEETGFSVSSGYGILRTAVPKWLATDELRQFIIGYSEAGQGHGGSGALYVQIRRIKRPGSNSGSIG
jgi:DNA-nicking Smr family endonuclease